MYVVGLSGGIGSGKTVASDRFAKLGIDIVDTDIIAREIVLPGKPALQALVNAFGQNIILTTGELNRSELRSIAFSSSTAKAKLDAITHPAIRTEALQQIQQSQSRYCLVVVPLLSSDSPFKTIMQRVLIVTAKQEVRIQRVKKRSNLSHKEVINIMATQLSDAQRLTFADDVIENNTSLDHVYQQVDALHQSYLTLEKQHRNASLAS